MTRKIFLYTGVPPLSQPAINLYGFPFLESYDSTFGLCLKPLNPFDIHHFLYVLYCDVTPKKNQTLDHYVFLTFYGVPLLAGGEKGEAYKKDEIIYCQSDITYHMKSVKIVDL